MDYITVGISSIAIILSSISFYYEFLHKPNSLLVVIGHVGVDKVLDDEQQAAKISAPLIFINNGRRKNALVDMNLYYRGSLAGYVLIESELAIEFSIDPGDVLIKKLVGLEEFGKRLFPINHDAVFELGISFRVITDEGETIASQYIIAKINRGQANKDSLVLDGNELICILSKKQKEPYKVLQSYRREYFNFFQ